jgi:hypothetical protein
MKTFIDRSSTGASHSIIRCLFPVNAGYCVRFHNWIIFATMLFFLLPSISPAAQVTLSWAPGSQLPDGYLIFQRIEGEAYDDNDPVRPIDGKDHTETTCTIEGLAEGVTYYFIVRAYLGSEESGDSNELSHKVPVSLSAPTRQSIPKVGWDLVWVDSEELVGEDGAAVNAFDGDPTTIWHTQWIHGSPTHPHELIIDLGNVYKLNGFSMLPRQDGCVNGRIINYQFYVGSHPEKWSTPAASGRFADNATKKSVTFKSTIGRYIRLVALNESNGNPWTSVAEISVKGPN